MTSNRAHRCDIYKVARQCGVKLFDGHLHSPTGRKAYECYCKPTVREIGREHGEEHLRLVFMLMTGSRTNAAELFADAMRAVSSLIANHAEIERLPNLTEVFDKIDLGEIRQKSKDIKGMPRWHAAYVLIYVYFQQQMKTEPTFWDFEERAYG